MGWQVVSAEHPLKMSGLDTLSPAAVSEPLDPFLRSSKKQSMCGSERGNSFFEIRILRNPDPTGPYMIECSQFWEANQVV